MANKFFSNLKRLFTASVVINNNKNKQKVINFNKLNTNSVLQKNFTYQQPGSIRKTNIGLNVNETNGYTILRADLYKDYEAMDKDGILSTALDIYSDECTTKSVMGDIITINTNNEDIKKSLENLYSDVLNISFNLWSWVRNLVKYGDFILKLDIVEKIGIVNAHPLSIYATERIESPENVDSVLFTYDMSIGQTIPLSQNRYDSKNAVVFNDYEIAHFRLLSDTNFLPYGRCLTKDSYIETEYGCKPIIDITSNDKVWTYNINNDCMELSNVVKMIHSGKKEIIEIKTQHNNIKCTLEHPILSYDNNKLVYKMAKDLQVNDLIAFYDNLLFEKVIISIDSINNLNIEDDVYDIQVESDNHNFIANGFIVHNSMLEPARKVWKQLLLLEDAMLIQRIMRAPEKRVYKVDIGNIPTNEIETHINNIMNNIKKAPYMDERTGDYNLKFNMQPIAWYSLIPLIDRRIITIKQLAEEIKEGKQNLVYSIDRDNNNAIVPGNVTWCDLTKNDADIVRIILEDGSYLDSELEHPIMLRDGNYIKASDVKSGMSLMPFHASKYKNINKYEQLYNPSINKYELIHGIVANEFNKYQINDETDININCIVLSVEFLTKKEDVYCMTVDKYHNFAICTHEGEELKYGFFVKNSMMEDFVIPVRGGNSGTEIDTLPGLEFNAIDDIEYLRLKLLASLKIPKAFLGFDENAGDKSTLSSQDVRFSRTIERIQRIVESELNKIGVIHLYTQGFSTEEIYNFSLNLTRSSQIAELERLEVLDQRINIANSLKDLRIFSQDWVYENIFNITEDEIKKERERLVIDAKNNYRLEQINSEGNDPLKDKEIKDEEEPDLDEEYETKINKIQNTFIKDSIIKKLSTKFNQKQIIK